MKHILTFIFFLFIFKINAQVSPEFEHQVLSNELKKVETKEFFRLLNTYHKRLETSPQDVGISIERCRFADFAQYDDVDEYNPNQDLADSLKTEMYAKFKDDPKVILYKISQIWGEEKNEYPDSTNKRDSV